MDTGLFWVFECQKDLTRCKNSQNFTEFHKKLQTNAQKNADTIHGPGRFVQALQDYCLIFGVSKSTKMYQINTILRFGQESIKQQNVYIKQHFWQILAYSGQTFWQTVSNAVCTCNQVRTGRKKRRFFHDSGQNTIIDVRMPKFGVLVRFWTQVILKFVNGPTSKTLKIVHWKPLFCQTLLYV